MLAAPSAQAWDGSVTGTIAEIHVTDANYYGVRLYLSGFPIMCSGGPVYAYLNEADSNYKVYVAALMMAKAQNQRVSVYTTLFEGRCHIGYIAVLGS